MEVWRPEEIEAKRPEVLGARSLAVALALHLLLFVAFYVFAVFHFHADEPIVPIDLTVVVVENLDGDPDEPPPTKKPEPEPPPPPPPPQPKPKPKEPDPPKELEKIVTNIVEKVEKKEEKPKPQEPKKTAKELREERIKRMRDKAKNTKERVKAPSASPQPNGRTDKKTLTDAEIDKLLNAGYRPGRSTNLASSEEQRCISLIRQAFEEKWDKPPWTDTLRPMVIRVWFGGGGSIVRHKLEQSSGDPAADATINSAAKRVGVVRGLSSSFIDKYRSGGIAVRFTVKPQ